MSGTARIITCPKCRYQLQAPPGAPQVRCGVCHTIVNVPPAAAYGGAPAYPATHHPYGAPPAGAAAPPYHPASAPPPRPGPYAPAAGAPQYPAHASAPPSGPYTPAPYGAPPPRPHYSAPPPAAAPGGYSAAPAPAAPGWHPAGGGPHQPYAAPSAPGAHHGFAQAPPGPARPPPPRPAAPYGPGPAVPMRPPGGRPPQKKALLIGIAYKGTANKLAGTINDVKCMQYLLLTKFGFPEHNIILMTDDVRDRSRQPYRKNILHCMRWLVEGAQPGDSLVFQYSGHGGQKRDRTGEELDGFNETLLPLDHSRGHIIDDEINEVLVRPLGPGVTLHAIIDACHSGTVLDLPQLWNGRGWDDQTRRVFKGTSGGTAICFSGCDDTQTSADTTHFAKTTATGAMTYCFIQAVEHVPNATYHALLAHMKKTLKSAKTGGGKLNLGSLLGGGGGAGAGGLMGMLMGGAFQAALGGGGGGGGFTQRPQLSCDKRLDLNQRFHL